MAIRQNTSTSSAATFNLRFSAFLGTLYVSTKETEDQLKKVKNEVGGEAEVKKGYRGNTGDSASAKAIASLKNLGWQIPLTVDGRLTTAKTELHDINGVMTPFLKVNLRDDDGVYYISVDLGNEGAQMLARKLVNAEPGVHTWINMMSTVDNQGDRSYSSQGASLRQGQDDKDHEVKGIDPKASLVPEVNAALKRLEDAGLKRKDDQRQNDQKTFNAKRDEVTLSFHERLMQDVNSKFTAHYEARNAAKQSASNEADAHGSSESDAQHAASHKAAA